MIRRWGPFAGLVLLAAASGWVLKMIDPDALVEIEKPPHVPEVYMEDFVTTTMNEQGRPRNRIESEYMAIYPDETSELSKPYFELYRSEGPPWLARSERGWVSANGDVVLLLGKVNIWRNSESGERALDIRTEDLRVLPDSKYGETEEPVVIRTPNSESHGVGMRAYLDKSRIELLSRVRTYYQQPAESTDEKQ